MRTAKLLLLALVTCFIAGCPKPVIVSVPAADIVVARDGSGDHSSIRSAIGSAGAGDVIYVKAGIYREALTIEEDKRVRLVGAGPGVTIIDAGDEYAALTLAGDDCHVEGLTIRGASSHGIYVKGTGHSVRRCLITGNGDRGVYYSSFGRRPSARIEHCTVADNGVSGIYVPNGNPESAVTYCIIAFNGRGIVSDGDGGGFKVEHNCVFESGSAFSGIKVGDTNREKDPRFIAREEGDYRLHKASPCIGTAKDGASMGCF